MARLSRGQLLIVIGVALLSFGATTAFALAWLGGRTDTQLKMILYLPSSLLTASGLILIFYGARRLCLWISIRSPRMDGGPWP